MSNNPQGDTIEYTIPEPTQSEVDDLAAKLAVIDTKKAGVTIDQIAPLYKGTGRAHILARLATLEKAGRAKSELRSGSGPVAFQYWTLSE